MGHHPRDDLSGRHGVPRRARRGAQDWLVLFLPEAYSRTTLLWDPSDDVSPVFEHMVDEPDELLFCSGHAFLSDGRLLVVGGGGWGLPVSIGPVDSIRTKRRGRRRPAT